MTAADALDRLDALLAEHAFSASAPRQDLLWQAVRDWVAIPVVGVGADPDDDLLLFQAHLFSGPATKYSPGARFVLSFTRQFSYVRDEESAGMEHLIAELTYPDCAETRALVPTGHCEIWGYTGPGSASWIRAVETEHSFEAASNLQPTSFKRGRTRV